MASASAFAQRTYTGKVSDVLDGKTVVVDTETGRVTVEMQYIEIPDAEHPLYETVRDHLKELVLGKKVMFQLQGFSAVKLAGQLYLGDVDIAQQMLRDGAAWLKPTGLNSQSKDASTVYANNQELAKNEKRGIWANGNAKPQGLIRAEQIEYAALQEQIARENPFGNRDAAYQASSRPSKLPAIKNPKLGDVGSLLNSYDPETRTGYLSTTLLGIEMSPDELAAGVHMAVDVTYYYKEDDRRGRKSVYEFTVVCVAPKEQFAGDNDLWLFDDNGKRSKISSPQRTVFKRGDHYYETLKYRVSKAYMTKLINTQVFLKVRNHVMLPTGIRYMLLPMIQADG